MVIVPVAVVVDGVVGVNDSFHCGSVDVCCGMFTSSVDLMIVVLLDPGITDGRTFAAFRALSNIRTGCDTIFLFSDGDDDIDIDNDDDDDDDDDDVDVDVDGVVSLPLLLLKYRSVCRIVDR
jgi:hypothetical protein